MSWLHEQDLVYDMIQETSKFFFIYALSIQMNQTLNKDKRISDIIRILNETLQPERIYLFGSRAAGTGNAHSDYDIAIEGHTSTFRDIRKTKEKLDQSLGIYSFDLVELEKVGPKFRKLVREKGSVIYERD